MSAINFNGDILIVQGPGDDPGHPINVAGRLLQRLACAGFVIWAARRDLGHAIDGRTLERMDDAFCVVSSNVQVALETVARHGPRWSPARRAEFRHAAAVTNRNVRKLRRLVAANLALVPAAWAWDGPKRPPRRAESHMISRAAVLWEAQEGRHVGTG